MSPSQRKRMDVPDKLSLGQGFVVAEERGFHGVSATVTILINSTSLQED